jgi:2-oxoglutarate dehydrogenase E1 component
MDKSVAIIRLEQIYPFRGDLLQEALKRYKNIEKIIWAQEEPRNQGAWEYIQEAISLNIAIEFVGRERIQVPDTGSLAFFHYQQEAIIKEALG